MSVWGDVRRRADGKAIRKEDKFVEPDFTFPIVRKVFAQTISSDLIPVQPMAPPTGHLFWFK